MAGDAHLRASLTLSTNLEEAVKEASKGLSNVEGVVAKSQDRLTKIIEKGDPLFAIRRQQAKEIAEVEKHVAKDARLRELAEVAKTQIVEKYARRRQQIEERAAINAEKMALATRDRVGRLEQKINDARGVMDSLGVASNTAFGQIAQGVADVAAGFGSGGVIGLAIAGTTAAVYGLATAFGEQKRAAIEAAQAAATEYKTANDAIQARIDAVTQESIRRRLKMQGVSDTDMQAFDLRGAAENRRREQGQALASLGTQLSGVNMSIAEEQQAIAEIRANGGRADIQRLNELERDQAALILKIAEADKAYKVAADMVGRANAAAAMLVQNAADEARAKAATAATPAGVSSRHAGATATGPIDWSGLAPLWADAEERARKRDAKEAAVTRQITAPIQQAANESVDIFSQAGLSAGASFATGIRAALEANDTAGMIGAFFNVAGAAANFAAPGAGSFISAIGGFFKEGGNPYALHLPQGRNGLAVMPGLNFDAKPAWLHKGEVVMPESVVNDTFGGLPNAMRIAAGGPMPGGGGRVVNNYFAAFDPRSLLEMAPRIEGVHYRRGANRQASKLTSQQRRQLATPRMGR